MPFAAPSPKPPSGATCWVCLEGNDTAAAEPLLRNCACRGSSGYAHPGCVAEHSRRESKAALADAAKKSKTTKGAKTHPLDDSHPAVRAWTVCRLCKQDYCGDFALALTERWVSSTSDELADHEFPRLDSLQTLASLKFDVGDYSGAIRDNERLLKVVKSAIDTGAHPSASGGIATLASSANDSEKRARLLKASVRYYRGKEAEVLKWLGMTYCQQVATSNPMTMGLLGGKGGFSKARKCLERSYSTNVELFGADSPRAREIDHMLSSFRDDGPQSKKDTAAAVRRAKVEYRRLEKEGDIILTLNGAQTLVLALVADGKRGEAFKLLSELEGRATRLLGPDHAETKRLIEFRADIKAGGGTRNHKAAGQMAKMFDAFNADGGLVVATIVRHPISPVLNGREVYVLRRTKDGAKYIVFLPDPSASTGGSRFKAGPDNLEFASGTKITVRDLKSAVHLNGKSGVIESFDHIKGRYVVKVDEEGGKLLKPESCEILFP